MTRVLNATVAVLLVANSSLTLACEGNKDCGSGEGCRITDVYYNDAFLGSSGTCESLGGCESDSDCEADATCTSSGPGIPNKCTLVDEPEPVNTGGSGGGGGTLPVVPPQQPPQPPPPAPPTRPGIPVKAGPVTINIVSLKGQCRFTSAVQGDKWT
jgi:hypothetical protein